MPGHDAWGMVSIDVAEFVEVVVGRPVSISGNSAGGIITLRCASRVSKWVQGSHFGQAEINRSASSGAASRFRSMVHAGTIGALFNLLKMYDPDFGRAFVDERMYGDFDHSAALSAMRCPMLVLHPDWKRLPSYGLVGAMGDDDAKRIQQLVPQARCRRVRANHVIEVFRPRAVIREIVNFVK